MARKKADKPPMSSAARQHRYRTTKGLIAKIEKLPRPTRGTPPEFRSSKHELIAMPNELNLLVTDWAANVEGVTFNAALNWFVLEGLKRWAARTKPGVDNDYEY